MNEVTISGKLAKDAEVKTVGKDNIKMCRFDVIVSRDFGKGADFLPVTAWREAAGSCEKLTKGAKVKVTGRIEKNRYEKDGKKFYPVGIVADKVEAVG